MVWRMVARMSGRYTSMKQSHAPVASFAASRARQASRGETPTWDSLYTIPKASESTVISLSRADKEIPSELIGTRGVSAPVTAWLVPCPVFHRAAHVLRHAFLLPRP